jgi:coenzyme F420-reducing hydrogenase delta subunit
VNGSRPGTVPVSAVGPRLSQPEPEWPIPVHEIALPCTGRLQPEHLLKAFEAGADAVCIIACAGDNCHYLEGSRRAERRAEYVRQLLDEIGLGGERLMVFRLAASAQEDGTLGHLPADPSPDTQLNKVKVGSQVAEIHDMVMARLGALQPNPLGQGKDII